MRRLLAALAATALACGGGAARDDGSPDAAVDAAPRGAGQDPTFRHGSAGDLEAVAVQADGKILAAGAFGFFNGLERNRIARLQSNGDVDDGFVPGAAIDAVIRAIVPLPDGKVVVAGDMDAPHLRRIGRLASDGTVDVTFGTDAGANGSVLAVARQPDGKLLIGGHLTAYAGQARAHLARLNQDGTLDPSFTTAGGGFGPLVGAHVTAIALQPDGKIVAGGLFADVAGEPRRNVARLHSDGTLDRSFDPGDVLDATSIVRALAVQPDGKIIVGGAFAIQGGGRALARLDAGGALDRSFVAPFARAGDATVAAILLEPDGKLWIGGSFQDDVLPGRNHLARLNADGSVDGHDPGHARAFGEVLALARQPDGKVLAAGSSGVFRLLNGR